MLDREGARNKATFVWPKAMTPRTDEDNATQLPWLRPAPRRDPDGSEQQRSKRGGPGSASERSPAPILAKEQLLHSIGSDAERKHRQQQRNRCGGDHDESRCNAHAAITDPGA